MENTALEIAQDRFMTLVAGIQNPQTLQSLFVRVYEDGETIELGAGLPIAYVLFLDENESESSAKIKYTLPVIIGVEFDLTAAELSIDPPLKPRQKGARLLGDLKAAILEVAARKLPGANPAAAAIDIRYTGGAGVSMVSDGLENSPQLWGFLSFWEIDYRHLTTDPTAVA